MNSDQRKTRVTILTARKEEYEPLLPRIGDPKRKLTQNHPYYQQDSDRYDLTVTHTGVGSDSVKETLGNLEQVLEPELLIILGTAGSLHEDVSFGDFFVPTSVYDESGDQWIYPDTDLMQWLLGFEEYEIENDAIRTGPLATVNNPAIDRENREQLHESTQAMIADMETFAIAKWFESRSSEESIGWVCARVVSDNIDTNSFEEVKENQRKAIDLLGSKLEPVLTELQ